MRKRLAKLPSPAMAVAFIALLAALAGTAVALPGSNNVTSNDIRSGAVGTSELRNNSVRGGDIRNSTIGGRDVASNTLTGSDINESRLGRVPSAGTAGAANTANSAAIANRANSAALVDRLIVANQAGRNLGDDFSSQGGVEIARRGPFSLRLSCNEEAGTHFSSVLLVGPPGSLAQDGEGNFETLGPAPGNFVLVTEANDEGTGETRFLANSFNVAASSGSAGIQARGYAGINSPDTTTECIGGGTLEG